MNNLFSSVVLGILFICIFYSLCLFLVVGIKMVFLTFKSKFTPQIKPKILNKPCDVEQKNQAPKVRKPKSVRSIEINPDDVDRIYVRKSS